MNFFTLGYVLVVFQLKINWISAYVLKAVGMVFIILGITEIGDFRKAFLSLRKSAKALLALFCGCAAAMAVISFAKAGDIVVNIVSIAAGISCAAAVYLFIGRLIAMMKQNDDLVHDNSNIRRLSIGFNRMMLFTAINLLFDILYRFFGRGFLGDFIGVVQTVTKIIMIVYVFSTGMKFNRIRNDFNMKHADEFGSAD